MQRPENFPVPAKVSTALSRLLSTHEQVLQVTKTAWKPTATIPILWLALTNRRLFLFSTLRGGSLFKEAHFRDINAIRLENGNVFELLMCDPQRGDLRIPIAPEGLPLFPDFISAANSCVKNRVAGHFKVGLAEP